MSFIQKIMGPKSKYDKSIPYTYEARVNVFTGLDIKPEYTSHFADTICGLINHLDSLGITPDQVELFEIYQEREVMLELEHCLSEKQEWLKKPLLCSSLSKHYEGHIHEKSCSFQDRDARAS